MDAVLSRAACPYCGANTRPNSLYCLDCGQVAAVAAPRASAPRSGVWEPPPLLAPIDVVPVGNGGGFAIPASVEESSPPPPRRRRPTAQAPALPEVSLADGDRPMVLVFSTGDIARVRGAAVIGRNPDDVARNSGRQPVAVDDQSRSMSRAHAMIDLAADGAYVYDAGSANGSQLERAGVRRPLTGEPRRLANGDRLWFGDIYADVALNAVG